MLLLGKRMLIDLFYKIRDSIFESMDMGTWHGYAHMIKAKNPVGQGLWFACIMTSTGLCFYMGLENIFNYLNFDVTTTTRYNNEKESVFPSVAICNSDPFTTKESLDFLITVIEEHTNSTYNTSNISKLDFINTHFYKNYQLINQARYMAFNYLNSTEKKKLGLQLDELIINCEFDSEPCNLETDFTWGYSLEFGNCYIFNYLGNKTLKSTGMSSGLALEIFRGFEAFFPTFYTTYGFELMIFNETKNFSFHYLYEKTSIRTGVEVNINVRRNFIEKMIKPYSECEIDMNEATIDSWDSDLYREFFERNQTYEQSLCFRKAYKKEVSKNCGCLLETGTGVGNITRFCISEQDLVCAEKIYKEKFLRKRFDGAYDQMCPLTCNSSTLTLITSSKKYPSYTYAKYLLENNAKFLQESFNKKLTKADIDDSVSKVNIYYDHLGYELIAEAQIMTVVNLCSNTGGLLGEFL